MRNTSNPKQIIIDLKRGDKFREATAQSKHNCFWQKFIQIRKYIIKRRFNFCEAPLSILIVIQNLTRYGHAFRAAHKAHHQGAR